MPKWIDYWHAASIIRILSNDHGARAAKLCEPRTKRLVVYSYLCARSLASHLWLVFLQHPVYVTGGHICRIEFSIQFKIASTLEHFTGNEWNEYSVTRKISRMRTCLRAKLNVLNVIRGSRETAGARWTSLLMLALTGLAMGTRWVSTNTANI